MCTDSPSSLPCSSARGWLLLNLHIERNRSRSSAHCGEEEFISEQMKSGSVLRQIPEKQSLRRDFGCMGYIKGGLLEEICKSKTEKAQ